MAFFPELSVETLDLLHKWNRPPLIPPYKGGKLKILLPPQYIGEGWGGVIQGFLQEVYSLKNQP